MTEAKKNPASITREALLAHTNRRTYNEHTNVPGFEGVVFVTQSWMVREREMFDAASTSGMGKKTRMNWKAIRPMAVALSLVDAQTKKPIFNANSQEDLDAIRDLPASTVEYLFDVVRKENGLTEDSTAEERVLGFQDDPA